MSAFLQVFLCISNVKCNARRAGHVFGSQVDVTARVGSHLTVQLLQYHDSRCSAPCVLFCRHAFETVPFYRTVVGSAVEPVAACCCCSGMLLCDCWTLLFVGAADPAVHYRGLTLRTCTCRQDSRRAGRIPYSTSVLILAQCGKVHDSITE